MTLAYLRPAAIGTYDEMTLGAGASKVAAVDPGPNLVHDDDASYLSTTAFGGDLPDWQHFTILQSSIPSQILRVNSLKLRFRAKQATAGAGGEIVWQCRFRMNGSDGNQTQNGFQHAAAQVYDDFVAGVGQFQPLSTGTGKPGDASGAWTPVDLRNNTLEFGVGLVINNTAAEARVTSMYLELDYTPIGAGIEPFREVVSRRLRIRRLPHGLLEITVPTLEFADVELGQLFCLSHPELPGPDLTGAGVKAWQRWPIVKLSTQIDERANVETMIVRDMREILATFWNMGKSSKPPGPFNDGIARLDAGNARTWLRASSALVRSPADTLVQMSFDAEHVDKEGELYQGASTNEIIQSGFKSGTFTGWSTSGTGVSGSAIAADSAELLFDNVADSTLPGQSVKLTAGTPPGADLYIQSTATASILASTVCRPSFWHKDDSGAALYYAIQRSIDSNWWRDSDQTWQGALTWNPMVVSTSRARHKTKQMNVGGSNTTLTVRVGVPSANGVAGQINHLYHVQVEKKNFVTSAILTDTAIATRAADKLTIDNPSNAPAWPPERLTARCKVIPGWDAADVATVNKTVFYVEYDSSNYDWLYFDGPNARWVYERKAAGVTYRAVKAAVPVAGTQYDLAARATSDLGDLGLPNYTLSIFVDKVKGTDVTAAALVVATSSSLEVGSKAAAENFDGNIWAQEVTQQALTDAQVARY